MSLLASLLYDRPLPVPPRPRQVIAPEMLDAAPNRKCYGRTEYGSVQPRILEYLSTGVTVTPSEISKDLDLNYDSVLRALRALHKKGQVRQIRDLDPVHHTPSLWGITGEEDQ
jgi:hypothetical protein